MYFAHTQKAKPHRSSPRVHRWLSFIASGVLALAWPLTSSARDSSLISPETPINPVLIVGSYSQGICSQSLSGDVLSRVLFHPGPEPDGLITNPQFIVCRTLPRVLGNVIAQRGGDVVVRTLLLPGRVSSSDYAPQEREFQRRELSAPENASRYALVYTGVTFGSNLHILGFLSVFGPMDAATGARPDLGRFLLNENVFLAWPNGQTATSIVPGIEYHLRSPQDAGSTIANSLEARCTKTGWLNNDKCSDRLHLQSPN